MRIVRSCLFVLSPKSITRDQATVKYTVKYHSKKWPTYLVTDFQWGMNMTYHWTAVIWFRFPPSRHIDFQQSIEWLQSVSNSSWTTISILSCCYRAIWASSHQVWRGKSITAQITKCYHNMYMRGQLTYFPVWDPTLGAILQTCYYSLFVIWLIIQFIL